MRISHYHQMVPVVLKLSQEALQITTSKKQEIMGHNAYLNDVFHISEIEDVTVPNSRPEDHEFIIKCQQRRPAVSGQSNGGSKSGAGATATIAITFTSAKRDIIVQVFIQSFLFFMPYRFFHFHFDLDNF